MQNDSRRWDYNVVGHIRLTGTVAGGIITGVTTSELAIKGILHGSPVVALALPAGVIITIPISMPLPVASRRCFHGIHDPIGNFSFLGLFQPIVVMSEPSDNSIVIGMPFQAVVPPDGQYVVDCNFGIIMI